MKQGALLVELNGDAAEGIQLGGLLVLGRLSNPGQALTMVELQSKEPQLELGILQLLQALGERLLPLLLLQEGLDPRLVLPLLRLQAPQLRLQDAPPQRLLLPRLPAPLRVFSALLGVPRCLGQRFPAERGLQLQAMSSLSLSAMLRAGLLRPALHRAEDK
eukprot:CAMPEP_0181434544 /NCGR_PEP_ID=MMETSP1110-20121109/19873_1 /TAXON_ID=174948 /ORGANISM="Symbiodinium sp., Strain CCMP421" /LENGTH=160 /DNA_ID=CAMNT_0023558053 /DNA_START=260 /DNA_END=740 /DNA_ORIENTATION=+